MPHIPHYFLAFYRLSGPGARSGAGTGARSGAGIVARIGAGIGTKSHPAANYRFVEQVMPGSKARMERNDMVTDGTTGWWWNDFQQKVTGRIWTPAQNSKQPPPNTEALDTACRRVTVHCPETGAPKGEAWACHFW